MDREEWSAEEDARLRRLWDQRDPQLSTRVIGLAMGRSKSSVVGRSHRLHLPKRPSPILRGIPHSYSEKKDRSRPVVTLPSLAVEGTQRPKTPDRPYSPFKACQWIDGEERPYRFTCSEPAYIGAWCRHHRARVYVRRQDVA